jgi:hypothetical protein
MTDQEFNQIIAVSAKWAAAIITAGGGGAAVAYGLFKHFGKSWLDQHFKEKLEELQHAHQQEIELLKHTINSLFSRVSKIHQKEFEVLPTAWLNLNELHGTVMIALDLTMKYYPDFERLPEARFEEFLSTSRLTENQRNELRRLEPARRDTYFSEAMAGIHMDDANEKLRLFKNYLIEYSIFMTDELREKFNAAHKTFVKATVSYAVGKRAGNWEMEAEGSNTMLDESLTAMINDVEKAVQNRLHYHEA